jgi:hypothetical protein
MILRRRVAGQLSLPLRLRLERLAFPPLLTPAGGFRGS